eukprot:m.83384 g.83384  ORF g.83384 m.83384 type:complete len:386 (+) comp21118_c1_seq2:65-1222(+)
MLLAREVAFIMALVGLLLFLPKVKVLLAFKTGWGTSVPLMSMDADEEGCAAARKNRCSDRFGLWLLIEDEEGKLGLTAAAAEDDGSTDIEDDGKVRLFVEGEDGVAEEEEEAEEKNLKPQDNAINYFETSCKFRVTAEKRQKKAYDFARTDLAGSLGAGVELKFPHWKVNLKQYDINVFGHFCQNHDRDLFLGIELLAHDPERNRVVHGTTSMKPHIAYLLSRVCPVQPGMVVLDSMCGVGTIPFELAINNPHVFVLAGDFSEIACEKARKNLTFLAKKAPLVSLFSWDSRTLPLVSDIVDVIISDMPWGKREGNANRNRVMYPKFMKEWLRVLKVGGRVVAVTLETKLFRLVMGYHKNIRLVEEFTIKIGFDVHVFVIEKCATE